MSAYRLAGDCPACGARIVFKKNRRDNSAFIACSAYPECRWTEPYISAMQAIGADLEELRRAHNARTAGRGFDLKRELRNVIVAAHPDRWPDAQELAKQVTQMLNALRDKL